jgi:hypothetical protein
LAHDLVLDGLKWIGYTLEVEEIVAFYHRRGYVRSSPPQPASEPSNVPLLEDNKARVQKVKDTEGFPAGLSPADVSFIESIGSWLDNGRNLSVPQNSWLERIEKKCATPLDTNWFDASVEENQKKRAYAIQHYKATGYYATVIFRMEVDSSYMPEKAVWEKMWSNKFINAAFKRWTDGSRFNVGDMVVNKYFPACFGTIAVVQTVKWFNSNWYYDALPLNPAANYEGRTITTDEKMLLPASKRNLTAIEKKQ